MGFQYLAWETFQQRLQELRKDILRKGAEDFHSLWKRMIFHSWFPSVCTFSSQLQLDLRDRILSNPLAWVIMELNNSHFISFLLSLYLTLVFITKPLD